MGNTGDATVLLEFGANPTHVGAVWDRFHHYKDAAGGKTAATTSVTKPKCDIHPLGVAALKRPAIYISGVVEAAGAVLVFFKEAEAAWLLIGLMVAVFPANVYHAVSEVPQKATGIGRPTVYYRLLIQLLFIGWAHWHTTQNQPGFA
eukprot:gene6486-26628_t